METALYFLLGAVVVAILISSGIILWKDNKERQEREANRPLSDAELLSRVSRKAHENNAKTEATVCVVEYEVADLPLTRSETGDYNGLPLIEVETVDDYQWDEQTSPLDNVIIR